MAEARPNLRGARVLIVDDHADTLAILREVLPFCGASPLVAQSAREAVPLLDSADVVVTDLAMPEHDGVWLLGHVRRLPRRVPVVAVTGYTATQQPVLADAGFDRVLLKPVDPLALCEVIESVLGGESRA